MEKFQINATPAKRLFMSIIADYDFKTSICELVDNAIDHWVFNGRHRALEVKIFLNFDRQQIVIEDNAGGVPKQSIELLVTPGASRDPVDAELIGNFGVGGKRAAVALGSRTEVVTQFGNGPACRFVLDDDWLSKDSWMIDIEQVESSSEGTTKVKVTELRQGLDLHEIERVRGHLGLTYGKYISENCSITINGTPVLPALFEDWAYPPAYSPQLIIRKFSPDDKRLVTAKITGGLTYDRDPVAENYGVYIYCNGRLIVSHFRSYEVGFHKGAAGTTHPDASLCRVIVELNGPPELMPWTSNKSLINWSNPTFLEVREDIIALATHFSKVSRGLKDRRETEIYPYQDGKINEIAALGIGTSKRIIDLPVPRSRKKPYSDIILDQNSRIMADAPWTRGLVESLSFIEIVMKRKYQTRNRIALILLDSNLEIGLKEYLVHLTTKHYSDSEISLIFENRRKAISEVKSHVDIDEVLWQKARHYYDRRNKLIHERATILITDEELDDYRGVVEFILTKLFSLDLSGH